MDQLVDQIKQLRTMKAAIEESDTTFEFKWENVGNLQIWVVQPNVGSKADKRTLHSTAVTRVIVDILNDGPGEFAEIIAGECDKRIEFLKHELTEEFAETMRS